MIYLKGFFKAIALISLAVGTLQCLHDAASAQRRAKKPPRQDQRSTMAADLELGKALPVTTARGRKQQPLPFPEEQPPFVKGGEKISSGMTHDVESSPKVRLGRIDTKKPIPAPEEPKP